MITGIRGNVDAIGPDWVSVAVGGVSVRVHVPAAALAEVGGAGAQVRLHTHLIARDDALMLYGFTSAEALRLFEMLIAVSGIGPRLALAVLSGLRPDALAHAIVTEDADALAQVSGVGKRTAGRIVLDLKGRLEKEWSLTTVQPGGVAADDVLGALAALGYSAAEARQAVLSLPPDADVSLEEQVRLALQRLSSR
jgi:Holliday junction DNA helicase RuvA